MPSPENPQRKYLPEERRRFGEARKKEYANEILEYRFSQRRAGNQTLGMSIEALSEMTGLNKRIAKQLIDAFREKHGLKPTRKKNP